MLLLLAVLSPRTRQGGMLLKLLALVMAGRRVSRFELSELSVLLHGRGSPCRGNVSVSELLCRLAPERPALSLSKQRLFYCSCFKSCMRNWFNTNFFYSTKHTQKARSFWKITQLTIDSKIIFAFFICEHFTIIHKHWRFSVQ